MTEQNLDGLSAGIIKAQSYYALYLGAQQKHSEVDADAAAKIDKAKAAFDKLREAELERVKKSQATVEQAKVDLETHQAELQQKYGAVVNLLAGSGGKRVSL